jgi:hypothetical protein
MPNIGATPIDTSSTVGQLRLIVGDTASKPLDPPQFGLADYAVWSDDSLAVAIATNGDNLKRAAAALYLQLAAQYAQQGKSIKTDDLALDTKNRSGDLISIAKMFIAEADAEESAEADAFFQIVPFAGRACSPIRRVEASPWPVSSPCPPPKAGDDGPDILDGGSP